MNSRIFLGGKNIGVAYDGVPLNKPLVPCVLLFYKGDSVELGLYEEKEDVDSSIPIPSNINAKSTWDSITLTWDAVMGASTFQVEMNWSKFVYTITSNEFSRKLLSPNVLYTFRIRTVKGNSVSEWSEPVKRKTQKIPEFSGCIWKECPNDVKDIIKYSVSEDNPRIATRIGINKGISFSTIIGNTALPLNKVTSWGIKILKSKFRCGHIYLGVSPFNINQKSDSVFNYISYGWYFHCLNSSLFSGPPHECVSKEYGPRKGGGQYVHTGDSVGVVMDTAKGELSFAVNGVNLGVAYEGIPLDKPLVPCVILGFRGDSVELII